MDRAIVLEIYEQTYATASEVIGKGQEHIQIILSWMPHPDTGKLVAMPPISVPPGADYNKLLFLVAGVVGPKDGFSMLISEAWSKESHKDEPEPKESLQELKDAGDPGVKESLLFNCVGQDWQAVAFCTIDRTTNTLAKARLRFVGEDNGIGITGASVVTREPRH